MPGRNTIAIVAGVALAGVGVVLAVTNPSQAAYEAYATQKLTAYIHDELCNKKVKESEVKRVCKSLLNSNQSELREAISNSTQQQNFILFSIYRTDLSVESFLPSFLGSFLSSLVPSYHFETLGVLQQFHVYQAQRQNSP